MTVEAMCDLYWLGYLLTGNRDRSAQAAIETLEMNDAANLTFASWMTSWARKIFIGKVLGPMEPEVTASALQNRLRELQSLGLPLQDCHFDPETRQPELERALLEIERFPRCALLLMVFEKLSAEDAAILLNADRELVTMAKAVGLIELTRNLSQAVRPRMMNRFQPTRLANCDN
jgi:hypothetical protein